MKYGLFGFMMPLLCGKVMLPYAQSKVLTFDKKKVMTEYKGMIARNSEIGTIKSNPLLPGLYLAAYALAFHKAYPEFIDGDALGEMTDLLAASDTMKKLYQGKDFFSEKNISSRAVWLRSPLNGTLRTGSTISM